MSKVLIERESVEAIARKLRLKTSDASKMKVSEIPSAIGKLQGYRTTARALSTDPVSYLTTTFVLSDMGTQSSAAVQNTSYLFAEARAVFNIAENLSFVTTAALSE